MYQNKTINEYLKELSSKSPVPGGGSAAALVGALGVSLLCKVANFTIGKEGYKDVEKQIRSTLDRAEKIHELLLGLCSEDAVAYKKLSDTFKLPKGEERVKKVQTALKIAMGVPFETCKNTYEAIKLCMPLVEKGNTNLITDVGNAALMLECAFKAALLNVEINLKGIKDDKFSRRIKELTEPMEKEVGSISQKVAKELERKIK